MLRRYADHYNTQTIKQYLAGDRKVRQWVIMAAKELGLTTTTEGGSNLTMNLTLMQDGYPGLEHALPIFPLFNDVVQLEAASGITYTPTLIVSYGGPTGLNYWLTHYNVDDDKKLRHFTPHDELDKWKTTPFYRDDQYVFKGHAEQLTKMVNAGGRVGLGSHGEVQGLGVHWELWMMQSGGMKTHDALRAATLHRRRRDRPREGPRLARGREARGPAGARPESARGHQEHEHDSLRDEERPALRRQHARRDLAAR